MWMLGLGTVVITGAAVLFLGALVLVGRMMQAFLTDFFGH